MNVYEYVIVNLDAEAEMTDIAVPPTVIVAQDTDDARFKAGRANSGLTGDVLVLVRPFSR